MESQSKLSDRSSTILCGVELPAIILGRALPKKPVPTIAEPSSLLSEFQLPFVIMDVNELTQAMGNTHLSDRREGDGEVDQLLFQPRAENGISDTVLHNIPRYLFRIASPYSDGATDAKWAKSLSAVSRDGSSTEDIFRNLDDEKRAHVARVLNLHLWWLPKEGEQDNFVSWTSSLLFAIQYIYYRSASSQDESSPADIKLYIIDTTKFPTGTFMRDLDLIDIFCEHNTELERLQDMRTTTKYYFGEYLSQGSLKIENKCQVIPADVLFQCNRLRRLQPWFGELRHNVAPKPLWAKEVIGLRGYIWPGSGLPSLKSKDMKNRLASLKEIMNHVADDWKFPIGIYFAALFGSELFTEGNKNKNEIYTKGFKYFRTLPGCKEYGPENFNVVATDRTPELQQVQKLVREIHKYSLMKDALDGIGEAETILRNLHFQNVFSDDGRAFAPEAPNRILAHTGQSVLSRLGKVRMLCDRLILDLSEGEGNDDPFAVNGRQHRDALSHL